MQRFVLSSVFLLIEVVLRALKHEGNTIVPGAGLQ